ncbi:unnamed protein product [Brassica oleracea]
MLESEEKVETSKSVCIQKIFCPEKEVRSTLESGARPARERLCRRRSLSLFVVVVSLRLFFTVLSTSALSDLWHRPHLLRWFGYGVTTRSSGGPRWRKWLACTVVVFSGRWRLLQFHRRRFELPGRESSSDSPSPAFSYGERRLPKFRASIWDPDVFWEKVTRLDLFHGRCGCRHGGFGSRRMRSQWKMMLSGEVTVFMKRKEMGHGSRV